MRRVRPASEDPEVLTLEVHGVLPTANTRVVVQRDPHVFDLARCTLRQRLDAERAGEPV